MGREAEVEALVELLRQRRQVTLTGLGGAGKTRLAREVAVRAAGGPRSADRWPDGVWWIDLTPIRDDADVASAVAAALSLNPAPTRPVDEAVLEAVADCSMLLVFDNCEHVIDSAARLITALLNVAGDTQVLATSRERLQIEGETAWPVPSLAQDVAVELFVQRTQSVWPRFRLTDENRALVQQVVARLDALPLALELAAAVVPVYGLDGVVARIDDAGQLLSRGKRTAAPRHQTLRALLDWSFELLEPDAQRLLERLSVFQAPVTLDSIVAVCRGTDAALPTIDVLSALGRLVEHSLVDVREHDGETQYRLLETVRQYARQRAAADAAAIHRSHAMWLIETALAEQDACHSAARGAAVRRLQPLLDDIRAALDWATAAHGDAIVAIALTGALDWLWISGVAWDEARQIVQRTLQAADEQRIADRDRAVAERVALGTVFYGVIGLAFFHGDLDEMLREGRRAVALWDSLDAADLTPRQRTTRARALALAAQLVGLAHAMRGEGGAALAQLDRAVSVANDASERWLAAVMRMRRALALAILGVFDAAVADYEPAMEELRLLGDWWFLSLALEGMATIAMARGDSTAAMHYARESILVLEPEPDGWFISRSLDTMAAILLRDSTDRALERAAQRYAEGEALRKRCGAGVIGPDVARHAETRTTIETQLGVQRFRELLAESQGITLQALFAEMRAEADAAAGRDTSVARHVTAETPVMIVLEIEVIGGFRLVRAPTSSNEYHAAGKVRELLCYLLLHPQAPKEAIGLALWPESSPAQVRNAFHVTLHHARRLLGSEPWIVFGPQGYSVSRAPSDRAVLHLDTDRFQQAVAAVHAAARHPRDVTDHQLDRWFGELRRSAADLLGSIPVGEWLDPLRTRHRLTWADAVDALAHLAHGRNDAIRAVTCASLLLESEPLRETTHRLLLSAYLLQNDNARALEHFRKLERLLANELGARPSPETRALLAGLGHH